MRKIDTSSVTTTTGMPVKSGMVDQLQLAYQEALTAITNNLLSEIYDSMYTYILYGCVNSGTGGAFNIAAGAVYYQGEIYLVDAASFTPAIGQTAVGSIVTTQNTTNADPVLFTDGITRNVNNIRKIVFAPAASGSGVTDFANLKHLGLGVANEQQSSLGTGYQVTFEQEKDVFFASAPTSATITFSLANARPGIVVTLKFTFSGANTITLTAPTGATVIRESGDLGLAASNTNILNIIYKGLNEAGNPEIRYTFNQLLS